MSGDDRRIPPEADDRENRDAQWPSDAADVGCVVIDTEGVVIAASESMTALFAEKEGDVGRSVDELPVRFGDANLVQDVLSVLSGAPAQAGEAHHGARRFRRCVLPSKGSGGRRAIVVYAALPDNHPRDAAPADDAVHTLRNALTAALANLELVGRERPSDRVRALVRDAFEAVESAAWATAQLSPAPE